MTFATQKLQSSSTSRLIIGWSLINLMGLGLVGALFHNFPLAFTFPPNVSRLGSFSFGAGFFSGLAFGFVPALLIGFLQRLILRNHWPISRWWIVSVSAGVGLMHFITDGFENARDLSIAVVFGGLVVGVVQWLLLRQHVKSSGWWILATVASWYLGWLMSYLILLLLRFVNPSWAGAMYQYQNQHGLQGLSVGIVTSLVNGALLVWFLRSQQTASSFR
jgi:hypothetical protein